MIKGIIFDVDGTLYHQKPVRIMMALNMMLYYLIHFWKIKELFIILKFRRIREKNTKQKYKDTLIQLSNIFKYDYKKIDILINKWMFKKPLKYIKKYKNNDVIELLNSFKNNNKKIIIYSDYNPIDKLKVLDINADYIFYPNDLDIKELKPSKKVMQYIIKKAKLKNNELLFFGDRPDKDGQSAKSVNIKFINVKEGNYNEKIY